MADQYRSEAEVKPAKNAKCAVPECKRKATQTIASARGNSYAYVPVCKQHHDKPKAVVSENPDITVRDVVSSY